MKRGFNEGVYKGTKGINRFTTDYIDWCWNHIIVTGVMVMLISKVWWTAILNNKLIFLESFEKAISYVGLNPILTLFQKLG